MEKLIKYLPLCVLISFLIAVWGEFILCFIRGYEELWYTVLVPGVLLTALAVAGYLTKFRWLFFIATALIFLGAILLIGFPSYVMYLAFICCGLSLIGEVALLILFIKNKRV